MLQVITHNTGKTEIIENYRKPNEKSLYIFKANVRDKQEYQRMIDKIYRVNSKLELSKIVKNYS